MVLSNVLRQVFDHPRLFASFIKAQEFLRIQPETLRRHRYGRSVPSAGHLLMLYDLVRDRLSSHDRVRIDFEKCLASRTFDSVPEHSDVIAEYRTLYDYMFSSLVENLVNSVKELHFDQKKEVFDVALELVGGYRRVKFPKRSSG